MLIENKDEVTESLLVDYEDVTLIKRLREKIELLIIFKSPELWLKLKYVLNEAIDPDELNN